MKSVKSARLTALPLLFGTFLLRANGGASTVLIALLLSHLSHRHDHLITNLDIGLLSVAYFAVELSLSPVMGGLSDRWGRKIFLTLGPLFGLLQVTLLFFTPPQEAFLYLLGVQMLSGIASAMQVPAVLGYLADYTTAQPDLRARVMSFYEMVTSLGLAVGVTASGFLWGHFERGSFFMLAAAYLVAAACMFSVPLAKQVIEHSGARDLPRRYWSLVRSPRLFIFIPAWISIFALLGIWLSSQVTFLLSSHRHLPGQILMGSLSGGDGSSLLSLILGAVVLLFGLSLLFWAFSLNRLPRLVLMLGSIGGVYLTCLGLTGLNHHSPDHLPLLIFSVGCLIIGIFTLSAFAPAALSYLAELSEETARDRGLLMGLYSVFLGVGQMLGNGLGGVFSQEWGFDGLIYLTLLLGSVALLALLWLNFWERKHRPILKQSQV